MPLEEFARCSLVTIPILEWLNELVELEIDGVFERMLLLKKKKYAALICERKGDQVNRRLELKGLDIVRRDWSRVSVEAGNYVVKQLLNVTEHTEGVDDKLEKIQVFLEKLKGEIESGSIPLSKLIITKQLTKSPETYTDGKSLPHVQVALRRNSEPGIRPLMRGDGVPYVICNDGTNNSATRRAYHPDELSKGRSYGENGLPLTVDVHYYLAQQIHPVVSRLCEPIPGLDANCIANWLGLDPVFAPKPVKTGSTETLYLKGFGADILSYKECEKFAFTCMHCKHVNEMDDPVRKEENRVKFALTSCSNPDCKVSPLEYLPSILNTLSRAMRKHIERYYEGWLVCEDPGCPNRVRRIPLNVHEESPVCNGCYSGCLMREYNESQLFIQLFYYHHIFDLSKSDLDHKPPGSISGDGIAAYETLKEEVLRVISYSSYDQVDLGKVFGSVSKVRKYNFSALFEAVNKEISNM